MMQIKTQVIIPDTGRKSIPFNKEYTNPNGGDAVLTIDANVFVIRYADVLLMLAEALHRGTGSDGEAQMFVDMVRERAAGPGDNTGNFRTVSQLMNDQAGHCLMPFGLVYSL